MTTTTETKATATAEFGRLKQAVATREAEQTEAETKVREAGARLHELRAQIADLDPDQFGDDDQPKQGSKAAKLVKRLEAAEREARELGPARVQKARLLVHEAEQVQLRYLESHRGELLRELEPAAALAVDRIESAIAALGEAVQSWFSLQRQVGEVIGMRRVQEIPAGDELHQLLRETRRYSGQIPEPLPVEPRIITIREDF